MHRQVLIATLVLGLLGAPTLAQKPSSVAKKAAIEWITGNNLKDYLSFIASDALMGRDTPSPGLDAAAQFMAFFLKRWGFTPMGDSGSFFQKVPLTRVAYDAARSDISVDGRSLEVGRDFAIGGGSGFGEASGDALLLRVSTALPADADLSGKTLVVLGQRREFDALAYAKRNGAVALVRLVQGPQEQWERLASFRQRGGGFRPGVGEAPAGLPFLEIGPDAAVRLLEGESTVADVPQPMIKKLALKVAGQVENVYTQNVVALWPGSDAKTDGEVVALGAHYDHIGGTPGGPTDNIFNGADDDGSGTVALLSMCEALGRGKVKTRRGLLFVWHCGEEKGLWGSAYFTDRPTVPLEKITAQLNIDMIGRSKQPGDDNPRNTSLSGPEQIYVIGSRRLSTELGAVVERVNASFLKLNYDLRYDEPNDPNRFYFRSDHFNYARKGIPIAFWFDGVHADYHRPSDEVDKIDFAKLEKVARTIFLTATTLADLPSRPKVDRPAP